MLKSDLNRKELAQSSKMLYIVGCNARIRHVDYWTGTEYQGGQTIKREADLATVPIFVKKDSIVPSREVQQRMKSR
jgi:alpha-glucosidase (family GH31 glycosyl hydrolase)